METCSSPTNLLPPHHAERAWTIAKITGVVLALAALLTGIALAGEAFIAGIVVESTAAAEARSQVANAAFGNAVGIVLLAAAALGCAIRCAVGRGRFRWAVIPAVALSLAAFAVAVPTERQVDRAHCMLQGSNVTQC